MNGRRRIVGSFTHGSMAGAVPQAIGVQMTDPDRQVITLSGDGGLAMLMGELLTVVQHDLPIKIVVFDNSSYNFDAVEMKADGVVTYGTELENRDFSLRDLQIKIFVLNNSSYDFVGVEMKADGCVNYRTELENPDFSRVAEAVGIKGFRVDKSKVLTKTVKEFLAHEGPALIDVEVEQQELSIPPSITAEQAKGFTLYSLRTVLSGRGDELVDLAKANLRQLF